MAIRQRKCVLGEISRNTFEQVSQSYFGMLSHCHSYKLQKVLI